MSRRILGLDIRRDAVSAVLMTGGAKGASRFDGYARELIVEQEDTHEAIGRAVQKITELIDVKGAVCAVGIPSEMAVCRNIKVPFRDKKKIKQILDFEIESALPFPVEDLVMDFQPVMVSGQGDDASGSTDLLTVAIQKTDLETCLGTLSLFGVDPETVTVGGYPTALCIAGMPGSPGSFLALDIDNEKSTLFAVASGDVILIRPFYRNNADIDKLCLDIKQTLSACDDIFGYNVHPERLFITGPASVAFDYEQKFAAALDIPVSPIDLVKESGVTLENSPDQGWKPELMDHAFALAAMKLAADDCLNFRKGAYGVKRQWLEHRESLIKTAVFAGIVAALLLISIFIDFYTLRKEIAGYDSRMTGIFKTAFPEVTRIVDPLQQMRVNVQEAKKAHAFAGETGQHYLAIDILNDMSSLIPQEIDVNLTRLVIGPESILISGDTDTFNSADDIKNRLETSERLKKITITSTNKDKTTNRINFKMNIDLKPDAFITGSNGPKSNRKRAEKV